MTTAQRLSFLPRTRFLGMVLALAAGVATSAQAQTQAPDVRDMRDAPNARADGPQPRHHAHGARAVGPWMMLMGPGLDRALDLVKATPQQRADIRRIAGAARDDLRAARQAVQPSRAAGGAPAWVAAWSADQIDVGALEAERQRQTARRDAMSQRVLKAAVDIGAVLQPEQRRQLAEHWQRMRGAHRRAEVSGFDEHAAAAVD